MLVAQQRDLGRDRGVVMEGRDIGTVVFPDADLKFYIDASPEERARRRAGDTAHSGGPASIATVQSALVERDKTDSTRAVAPLTMAPDAIYVDTTEMPIEVVVNHVMMQIMDKLNDLVSVGRGHDSRRVPRRGPSADRLDRGLPRRRRVAPGAWRGRRRERSRRSCRRRRRKRLSPSTRSSAISIASCCRASPPGSIRSSSATSRRTACCRACSATTSAPASA